MDKYALYVIVTYAVTLLILLGYLLWVWAGLQREKRYRSEA